MADIRVLCMHLVLVFAMFLYVVGSEGADLTPIQSDLDLVKLVEATQDRTALLQFAVGARNEDARAVAIHKYLSGMAKHFDPIFADIYKRNIGFSPKVRTMLLEETALLADGDHLFMAFFQEVLQNDTSVACQVAAIKGLIANAKGMRLPSVSKKTIENEHQEVRIALLDLVQECPSCEVGLDIVQRYLNDKSPKVVQRAAEVAGVQAMAEAKPSLMSIVSSVAYQDSSLVEAKIAALRALSNIASNDPAVAAVMKQCLDNNDARIRTLALEFAAFPGEKIDPGFLVTILYGIESTNRIAANKCERLLKDSMPQSIEQLGAILSSNGNFVVMDKCASFAMGHGRFELLNLLTRRIKDGDTVVSGKYSCSREIIYAQLLPSSETMIKIRKEVLAGRKVRLSSVKTNQADEIVSFLKETDPLFAKQDRAWQSNRVLVGSGMLLKAFCLWDAGQRDESMRLFAVVDQQFFDLPVVSSPMFSHGMIDAVSYEEFRRNTMSCLGTYSASILSGLQVAEHDRTNAFRTIKDAVQKGFASNRQVTDKKYSELITVLLSALASNGTRFVKSQAEMEQQMRARFKADSTDIQLALELLSYLREQGAIKDERELIRRLREAWPITLKDI
ncbi:MAG: hypothetical protein C0404_10820 [Verrucomicrobia bacterium]|nr:hypothetical protein [Verrucomicrobiota bacterium]